MRSTSSDPSAIVDSRIRNPPMFGQAAELSFRLAKDLIKLKEWDKAIVALQLVLNKWLPLIEQARKVFDELHEVDPHLKQKCYHRLGMIYHAKSDFDRALTHYQLALAGNHRLPLNEYVFILLNVEDTLRMKENYLDALYTLIELDEILKDNPAAPITRLISPLDRKIQYALSKLIEFSSSFCNSSFSFHGGTCRDIRSFSP